MTYDHARIESQCRQAWERDRLHHTNAPTHHQRNTFIYSCTPFTTGKAHMGHVRSYTLADACARWARQRGDNVLWAMGFDAFGLPNEIAAIEHGIRPADWVHSCCDRMTEQFTQLGLSVDWTRRFVTSDPQYYRWTQWVFLQLMQRGLIYRAEGIEQWCDTCRSVLASMQVSDDGRCWRCGSSVGLTCINQWYLTMLPYLPDLHAGLETLREWDDAVLNSQRALLGRTDGAELSIPIPHTTPLVAFTQFPDAISDTAFICISPNHELIEHFSTKTGLMSELNTQRLRALDRSDRDPRRILATATGLSVRIPGLERDLPVIITPAVDMRFGRGATLGIPSTDPYDAEIAIQLSIPIPEHHSFSPPLPITPASRYRARDNSISRQRGWGAPVPVIHCPECGIVPVPESQLPVELPTDLTPSGEGRPLADHPHFASCVCPVCDRPARRDCDTLDVHMDSIWMLIPFCVPPAERATRMFTHPDLSHWLPVDQVVCGIDQAGWWVNDRYLFRVLHDEGYLTTLEGREPVKRILMHEMIRSNGRKMSKHCGNSVDPDDLIAQFGADAVRLTVLRVDPTKAFDWNNAALVENHKFLADVWSFTSSTVRHAKTLIADPLLPGLQRNAAAPHYLAAARRHLNSAYEDRRFHTVLRELKTLFARIKRSARTPARLHPPTDHAIQTLSALAVMLEYLSPLAPHIAYTLRPTVDQTLSAFTIASDRVHTEPLPTPISTRHPSFDHIP